jgi:transposase
MAAARTPGPATARIPPRRHDQDPDPVPSRIRPGAAATSGPRHQCGAASAVLHPWLRERLSEILAALPPAGSSQDPAATQVAWAVWQAGLTRPFTLPDDLPPLRLLLVWDNLTGHKTPDLVVWLCQHGVVPLYTPVGGSWLNRAESIERVLKRRALDGQHPHSPDEIGSWFEQTARAWNEQPTPFVWTGKRRQRRRRSGGEPIHRLGGSGACTPKPLRLLLASGVLRGRGRVAVARGF